MEATLGLTTPYSFGRGWPQYRRLPNAAGNAEAALVVPGNRISRVASFHCQLVTAAEAGERFPQLVFKDQDGNAWLRLPAPGPVAEGKTVRLSWALGLAFESAVIGDLAASAIPNILLPPGMSVGVAVKNGLEGDAVSNVSALVEEFPNGWDGYPTGRLAP